MLKINSIKKSFQKTVVLNDCTLDVKQGTIFGLVGVNGAGKSTLLRCIAGVYELEEGSITFEEKDTYKDVEVRKDILYLSDDPYFERTSTIQSLKHFYKSFYHFDEEVYQKHLKMFGLDESKPINNFSKGMKRQTFLLFAMAIKPKLLMLDEAFDGLDPFVRVNFKKALFEILNDEEITVIISSHNLKELEDICDTFGILENGVIKTSGDLQASKEQINKYQVVFNEEKEQSDFTGLNILHFSKSGRVINMVIKGDMNKICDVLEGYNPLILDTLPVNFEELFIYEIESRGTLYE